MAETLNVILGLVILLALVTSPFWIIKGLRTLDRRSAERNVERLEVERQRTGAGVPGKPERAFLKACTHCRAFCLTLPYRDQVGRTYCSEACMQWLGEGPKTFCKKCTFETTAQSSGNLHTINGIGTRFIGSDERCGECRSVVRRVWFSVFFLPVIPLRKYRVIQISPRQFLSRRIRAMG